VALVVPKIMAVAIGSGTVIAIAVAIGSSVGVIPIAIAGVAIWLARTVIDRRRIAVEWDSVTVGVRWRWIISCGISAIIAAMITAVIAMIATAEPIADDRSNHSANDRSCDPLTTVMMMMVMMVMVIILGLGRACGERGRRGQASEDKMTHLLLLLIDALRLWLAPPAVHRRKYLGFIAVT
jgi:MFS family permease